MNNYLKHYFKNSNDKSVNYFFDLYKFDSLPMDDQFKYSRRKMFKSIFLSCLTTVVTFGATQLTMEKYLNFLPNRYQKLAVANQIQSIIFLSGFLSIANCVSFENILGIFDTLKRIETNLSSLNTRLKVNIGHIKFRCIYLCVIMLSSVYISFTCYLEINDFVMSIVQLYTKFRLHLAFEICCIPINLTESFLQLSRDIKLYLKCKNHKKFQSILLTNNRLYDVIYNINMNFDHQIFSLISSYGVMVLMLLYFLCVVGDEQYFVDLMTILLTLSYAVVTVCSFVDITTRLHTKVSYLFVNL